MKVVSCKKYRGMGSTSGLSSRVVRLNFHLPCVLSNDGSKQQAHLPLRTWTDSQLTSGKSIEINGSTVPCSNIEPIKTISSQRGDGPVALRRFSVRHWRGTTGERADQLPPDEAAQRVEVWAELDVRVRPNQHIYTIPSEKTAWRCMLPCLSASKTRVDAAPLTASQFESAFNRITSTWEEVSPHEGTKAAAAIKSTKKKPAVHALESLYASLGPRSVGSIGSLDLHTEPTGAGVEAGACGLNSIPTVVVRKGEQPTRSKAWLNCVPLYKARILRARRHNQLSFVVR